MNEFADQPIHAVPTGRQASTGRFAGIALGAGTVCLGMIAGMFFDWATSIMPALSEADDRTYVVVMQKTITTINNSPLFLLSFMGAFVFSGAAAVLQYRLGARATARWILAALALYMVAVLVTGVVHLPLNNTLEFAGDPDAIGDLATLRADTEQPWADGHIVRTVATTLALACLCRAMLVARRGDERTSSRSP